MKLRKVLLLAAVALVALTGCSINESDGMSNVSSTPENSIKLNVNQANLIADITDNEKYLNKELLRDVETLDDSDNISVIISLDSKGLLDSFNKDQKGFPSISQYVGSQESYWSKKSMAKEQEQLAEVLKAEKLINDVNHSYTTLMNGFSATTTYGQYKKLIKAGYDLKVTISEVYSLPKYEVTSTLGGGAVSNIVDVYDTGIFNPGDCGFDGNNTSVAVLDSGFDIHHTVFQNMPDTPMISRDDVEKVLYDTEAYSYFNDIKVQDVYMNSKIPFAYDYADKDPDVAPYDSEHGTHVAGIIGGSDEVITGVAVNTQLVLMKVFGDINNGAVQEDILAALEDAITLGVDAINLSLGTACGFSRSSDNEYINVVYDKIEQAGISVIVAASNDYSSGYGGEYSNTNKASNPDSATVGSPGTFDSTLSVASIAGVKSKYIVDADGYTFFYNNANNNAGEPYDFYDMLFEKLGPEDNYLEVEYVTVPGVGKKVNYSSIDVEGKIALVKRGDTTFEEKAAVALAEGAIGCIIYNNVAGDVFMNAGQGLQIALSSISMDDGEYLAAKPSGTLILDKSYLAGPFMSEFSSWGPVSDLSLKPEITAHGGSILSAVPGGGYEEISGTSMACPNLCGVVILVRQALKERYKDITSVELTMLTNQLLMSTGTIIYDETGNPYSPRKQGAGLGNLQKALDTLAYLSVGDTAKSKLDLGDDPKETGEYELVFDINNISDKELTYNLTNYTMTESLSKADPKYVAQKAYMLNPETTALVTGDGSINGDVITVNPNGKVTVKYTLKLTKQEIKYIQKSFVNGMYVEGFAVLESLNEDAIDLSIPFLAFFGDWTVAPMFDKTYYEVESEAHNGSIDEEDKLKADYYATTPLGTYYYSYIIPLGTYVYEMDESKYDPIPATEEHAAIGYSLETINGITTVYAGLLRNAKKMTTVIKNSETGEVVYEHIKYDEHKAYFYGQVVPGYDLINITAAELGLQNNTKYTFSMQAELDYDDGGLSDNLRNTFEFSFYVDYESPVITDTEFYHKYDKSAKEYRYYVDVYVYDNHYAQSIRPFTIIDGKLTSLVDYVIPIYSEERGGISKVTVEITDYMDLLQYGRVEGGEHAITNGLGFLVDDYALNQNYCYVTLPGTNSTNITYKPEYVSGGSNHQYTYLKRLTPGDVLDLTYMLTSDDPVLAVIKEEDVIARYFATLEWKSSNENVVKVKNGKIEAVGQGQAKITCTTMHEGGDVASTTLVVNVRAGDYESDADKLEDIKFTYFDTLKAFTDGPETSEIGATGDRLFFTEKPYISFYPSEKVQLGYELEPWNLSNYELVWASTNEKVATVDENGVVTAVAEGNANITLKVKIDGRTSSLMASTRVVVKSEFVIEGQTLTAYKGAGGKVVIPDDEGILYIGSFAFSLYTTDYEHKVENDDYDSAKTPSANDTVTSVVIPGDVMEIQRYAFYNCTALEKVTFATTAEGESCPFIKDYAFYNDKALKEINLDNVNLIGERAFYNCTSLTDINISKVYAMGRQAFAGCKNINYADITALRNAGPEIFLNCSSLATIDNGAYTNFSEGMFKNSGLESITFNADRIPNRCFEDCKNLTDATITRDIVYVGTYAFDNCTNLETVKFNEGCGSEFIYAYAFNNCTSLEGVVLPDSEFVMEQSAFNNCKSLDEVVFNANTKITNNLGSVFNGCTSLESFTLNNNSNYQVQDNLLLSADGKTIILAAPGYNYGEYTVPAGITKIAEGAFSSIASLTSLIVPDTVEEISNHAFENCANLTQVTLPTNGLIVGAYAFNGCRNLAVVENIEELNIYNAYSFANTALTSLVINDAQILEGAFSNIASLKTVTIDTLEIGANAFKNSGIETLTVSASVIGAYAFSNNRNLSSVDFVDVETIGAGAFINCPKLTTISTNAKYIGDEAFANNKAIDSINLTDVVEIGAYAFSTLDEKEIANVITTLSLPDSLVKIGAYAFYNSTSIKNVVIGNSIEEIGAYAFANNYALESITAGHDVKVIPEGAFAENEKLAVVNIPGIEEIGEIAFVYCYALETIDLSNVKSIGMQAFYYASALEEANMPNVTSLADGAFLGASKLAVVNMPSLEEIGMQAICYTAVTEIVIPSTIKYVAEMAFLYNENLTTFVDANGEATAKINDYAFLNDGVLYTVTENNKYLLSSYPTDKASTTYEVLFGTVRIDEYAAYGNKNIEKLILPDTLKLIGNMSFFDCTALNTVEFRSVIAPTLEGTITSETIEYEPGSEAFELVTKYFNFNGYYPYHYGQFKNYVGIANKMNIIVASNADIDSYTNILYKLYFNTESIEQLQSDYEGINTNSLKYLDNAVLIPENVSLADEQLILDTRTAYNLLNQDLTLYGYTQEYLDGLYENLLEAEEAWLELKMARVNKAYKYLIEDIKQLGATYEFDKIAAYYDIVKALELVDRFDEKYVDRTNVDSFKKGFDEYFKDLNEDINASNDITTLPTTTVNKVGLAVVAVISGTSVLGFVGMLIKKRWFF